MNRLPFIFISILVFGQQAFALSCEDLHRIQVEFDRQQDIYVNTPFSSASHCTASRRGIEAQEQMVKYRKYAQRCGEMAVFNMKLDGTAEKLKLAKGVHKDLCSSIKSKE